MYANLNIYVNGSYHLHIDLIIYLRMRFHVLRLGHLSFYIWLHWIVTFRTKHNLHHLSIALSVSSSSFFFSFYQPFEAINIWLPSSTLSAKLKASSIDHRPNSCTNSCFYGTSSNMSENVRIYVRIIKWFIKRKIKTSWHNLERSSSSLVIY